MESKEGKLVYFTICMFSATSCILFIASTYSNHQLAFPLEDLRLFKAEVFFTAFFIAHYTFQMALSSSPKMHIVSLLGILDVVTCVPVVITLAILRNAIMELTPVNFLKGLALVRPLRMIRLVRPVQAISIIVHDSHTASLYEFIGMSGIGFLLMAAYVQVLSLVMEDTWKNPDELQFHDTLYFTATTFSGIGYGDIAPLDPVGRMFMVCVIIVVVTVIPWQLSVLDKLLALRPMYKGSLKTHSFDSHVVICCDIECKQMADAFLTEFLHPDHGMNSTHIVFLVPSDPDSDWNHMLLCHGRQRLTFLNGDVRNKEDLERVKADEANAIFLLINPSDKEREKQEVGIFLRALSCRDFYNSAVLASKIAASNKSPSILTPKEDNRRKKNFNVFVQVFRKEVIDLFKRIKIPEHNILCLEEVNKKMLAGACLWQGLPTFLANLASSSSLPNLRNAPDWAHHYATGMGKEIYEVQLEKYVGWYLRDLVWAIFEKHSSILFAVSRTDPMTFEVKVYLYPGKEYHIKVDDVGFLITDDREVADEVESGVGLSNTPQKSWGKDEAQEAQLDTEAPMHQDNSETILLDSQEDFFRESLFTDTEFSFKEPRPNIYREPVQVEHASVATPTLSSFLEGEQKDQYIKSKSSSGPFVIIAPLLENVDWLFDYLHAEHFDQILAEKEILVICPNLDKEEQVETARKLMEPLTNSHATNVRFFNLPPKKKFLEFAEVSGARMIMILSDQSKDSISADADTLSTYTEVCSVISRNVPVIVELHETNFMEQLCILANLKESQLSNRKHPLHKLFTAQLKQHASVESFEFESDPKYNRAYVSGEVVLSTFPEVLLCQAYFNPLIIKVVSVLLSSSKNAETGEIAFLSQVLVSETIETNIKEGDIFTKSSLKRSSTLYSLMRKRSLSFLTHSTEEDSKGICFGDIFKLFLDKYDAVPVAIFRPAKRGAPGHVITCPEPNFMTRTTDKVFCLAKLRPKNSFQPPPKKGGPTNTMYGRSHFHQAQLKQIASQRNRRTGMPRKVMTDDREPSFCNENIQEVYSKIVSFEKCIKDFKELFSTQVNLLSQRIDRYELKRIRPR